MTERAPQPELIMVMGVQRSGTSILVSSLATDKSLRVFGESIDSGFYSNFRLRPVAELAPLIESAPGRILLKPISETFGRGLADVAEEFGPYRVRFVWIYRDPVNVLCSMQRERWVAAEEIAASQHLLAWRVRNEYALQFQRQSPGQIAIVRYEDLCLDRAVFAQLTSWLGLQCSSAFRGDRGAGRKQVSSALQRRIDAETSRTVRALDAARRFKPSLRYRWRRTTSRVVEKGRQALGALGRRELPSAKPASQLGRSPANVEGLYFWLHAAALSDRNKPVDTAVAEIGPHHMTAPPVENGPYAFLSLNLHSTLFYPPAKSEQRRRGASGTLIFSGCDWDFLFNGQGFTTFALFRPNPPPDQTRSVVFRIGRAHQMEPAFTLEWDACTSASSVTFQEATVALTAQSHPREQWRLVAVQCSAGKTPEVLISSDRARATCLLSLNDMRSQASELSVLELGGLGPAKETLFYGEIADIVIFRRALSQEECAGVARYLSESHHL
jgi:hypothetical protein